MTVLEAQWDHDRDLRKHWCPDDPDNWQDEAEDKESTDNERDDRESVPVVDKCPDCGAELPNEDYIACDACSTIDSYGYRFGDFIGE